MWVSTRATTSDVWSPPMNLNLVNQQLGGPAINGPAVDYVTTRAGLGGPDVAEGAAGKKYLR